MKKSEYPTFKIKGEDGTKYYVNPATGEFGWREFVPKLKNSTQRQDARAEEVIRRYSPYGYNASRDLEKIGNAIQEDMGIGKYKVRYIDDKGLKLIDHDKAIDLNGIFKDDDYELKLSRDLINKQPAWAADTIFHESAHMADHAGNPARQGFSEPGYFPGANPSGRHFEGFKNRDDLFKSLSEQRRIEEGQIPNKTTLSDMPWLKDVVPASSNRLSGPWRENLKQPTALSPEAWNERAQMAWDREDARKAGLNVYGKIREGRKLNAGQ